MPVLVPAACVNAGSSSDALRLGTFLNSVGLLVLMCSKIVIIIIIIIIIRSHFGSSRCWTSAPQRLEPKWSSHPGQSCAKVATSHFPCCLFALSRWFLRRVFGIMATVVSGNGRSCGPLTAVILGLMCVTLQGAAFRSAKDVVAFGHDSMESSLLLLDPPMRIKTTVESVLFWSHSYLHFPRANDRWCVQPWVLITLRNMPKLKNAKRIIETQKKLESFTTKLEELSMEKCKITTELT